MKHISMSNGESFCVDDRDFQSLSAYKWHVKKNKHTSYARTSRSILAHRLILGLEKGDERQADHIDGDGLNNCRENLRICTHQQNQCNAIKRKKPIGFKGIHIKKGRKYWCAAIQHNKKSYHIGYYKTPEEAAMAYDKKAIEFHGSFAKLNFPDRARGEGKDEHGH